MTARLYTIPASEVVPGMLLQGFGRVLEVAVGLMNTSIDCGPPTGKRPAKNADWGGHVTSLNRQTWLVTLPGPSPRAKKSQGGVCTCPDTVLGADGRYHVPTGRSADDWRLVGPDDLHDEGCPVRKCRLQLWPVGAKWDTEAEITGPYQRGAWVVDGCKVWPSDVRNGFHDFFRPYAEQLRAAFCEPEVQP